MIDDTLDTPDEGLQQDLEQGDASQESGKDKSAPYLGTWKTKDDADKGLAEMNRTMSKYQSERDSAKAEVKKLNATVLEKLTDAITQKGEAKHQSDDDIQAQIEKAAADIENGGGKAVIEWMSRYSLDAQTKAEANALAKLKPMIEALEKKLSLNSDRVSSMNPEYRAYSKEISELEKLGVTDKDQALAIAKTMKPIKQPARPPIPGSGSGDRAGGEDESPLTAEQDAKLSSEVNKYLKKPLTDAEKKALARKRG
ncbi:MAG: hypothetical protein WC476_11875 [Phycisphaerae bacterium]|jgi:chromosome segregation ATPase